LTQADAPKWAKHLADPDREEEAIAWFLAHPDDENKAVLHAIQIDGSQKAKWRAIARIFTHWYADPGILAALFQWLADSNWPGAGIAADCLVEHGEQILAELEEALTRARELGDEDLAYSLEAVREDILLKQR